MQPGDLVKYKSDPISNFKEILVVGVILAIKKKYWNGQPISMSKESTYYASVLLGNGRIVEWPVDYLEVIGSKDNEKT